MSKASLTHWLEHLEVLHPNAMDLGLDRIRQVALRLQIIPVKVPVITISGTNGKGSVSAVLEAVLVERGRAVGVCTSPHFLRFNERIKVAGSEVDDCAIVEAFEQIDKAREEISLTYFEFATLAALLVFRKYNVEIMILEVGLGGRLDAVNIVDAAVAVVTSIELDHQEWLGDTRDLIAVEKAGIFRQGQPAVIAEPRPPESLRDCARSAGVNALYLARDFFVEENARGWQATLRNPDGSARRLPQQSPGSLLPINISAALQALLLAGEAFSDHELAGALAKLKLPGRRETRIVAGCSYLMDVAHNPSAVDKLLEYIGITPCNGKTICIFSAMADKDIRAMVRPCAGRFSGWFLADQPDNPRAATAADLAGVLREEAIGVVSVSKNITQAFRRAQSVMTEGDRLVIFGSFFTVAAVMPLLQKDCRKNAS